MATQVLASLQTWAAMSGISRLVLEAGHRQSEAVLLYEKAGFRSIPCFGQYEGSDSSVCYEKVLDRDLE